MDSGEGVGGAIDSDQNGGLTLTNSTLTANTVGGAEGGGPLSGEGFGGGVSIASGATATLQHDTIDANSVASVGIGAGIDNVGAVTAVGTIVSGNTGAGNCAGGMLARDSLEGPAAQTSCGFDLTSADPLLAPLADNGGPTETQALGAGSPAVGAVVPGSDCPLTDQRGAGRLSGHCDVGAYEVALPLYHRGPSDRHGDDDRDSVRPGRQSRRAGRNREVPIRDEHDVRVLDGRDGATAYRRGPVLGLRVAHRPHTGTVYHYRVVATNPDGTVVGPDQQFTTQSPPSPRLPPPSNRFTFGKARVAPRGKITLPVLAPDAGRFIAKATFTVRQTVITHKHGKRVVKHVTTTFTYGTASVNSTGTGTFKLVIGLSARAAKELKLLGRRQVTIVVTFTPTGGTAHRESKKVTVIRSRKGKYQLNRGD